MKQTFKKLIAVSVVLVAVLTTGGFLAANYGFFSGGTNAPSVPEDTMTRGLVGYWEFEEGVGQTAYNAANTGSVNNGTLGASSAAGSDDPKWGKGNPEVSGGALQFDGVDDYMEVTDSDSLDITEAITIEAWVKFNGIVGTSWIVEKVDDTNQAPNWHELYGITQEGSGLAFKIFNGTAMYSASTDSGIISSPDTWYHVVAVSNGTKMQIYFNGANNGGLFDSSSIKVSSGKLDIGARDNYGYFNGSIDSVRIYNRALSADEVRHHYNRGGPVASWSFDEGSGTAVYDSSGNEFHGTLTE